MTHRIRPVVVCAALLAAILVLVGTARAASVTRDARLGDEFDTSIGPGDVQTYRLDLVAGTKLSLRVKDTTAAVTLTLRGQDDSVLAEQTRAEPRIDATVPTAGLWRVEVSGAGSFTPYEIKIEGDAPSTGGGGTTTPPGGGTVHVDVPRGAVVRLEARRVSGARPVVTGVRDGSGRMLNFRTTRSQRNRARLAPVVASAPGGLYVDVEGEGGQTGTYAVRYRLARGEGDDGPGSGETHEHVSRRIVIVLAPGADVNAVVSALGATLVSTGDGYIVVETAEGREGHEDEDAANAVDTIPDVTGAEPDAYLDAPEGTQSNAVILGSDLGKADVPNQPALDTLRLSVAQRRATGAGVVVAVLDTGVDATHEALAGHVLPGWDFIDSDADPSETTNGIDDDLDGLTDEGYGHGTFVAGLILATAPDVQILPVRVLDTDARGTVSGITAGIDWAVRNGANVINLSLSMQTRTGVLADAVHYAINNNVVVVAATGNDGQPAAVSYPAAVSGVLAVTSTDPTGAPATFANGGPGATVAVPGTSLIGPVPPTNPQGAAYGTWSGTSFSSAIASGAAALYVQTAPTATPAQVVQRFRTSTRRAPRSVTRTQRRRLGGGQLDLARLVR